MTKSLWIINPRLYKNLLNKDLKEVTHTLPPPSLCLSAAGIQEFPDNIKCCKGLSVVEASVNPITK